MIRSVWVQACAGYPGARTVAAGASAVNSVSARCRRRPV